jgi:hypothetical protein
MTASRRRIAGRVSTLLCSLAKQKAKEEEKTQ